MPCPYRNPTVRDCLNCPYPDDCHADKHINISNPCADIAYMLDAHYRLSALSPGIKNPLPRLQP